MTNAPVSHRETFPSPQLLSKARFSDLSPLLLSARVSESPAAWPFKSLASIRAPVSRERWIVLLSLSVAIGVPAGFSIRQSWSVGICPHSLTSGCFHPARPLPSPHAYSSCFPSWGPLRQCLPYMGTALNRGRSLAGAVTRASVNKGAGRGAPRASPREGVGPRGSGAHACGQPFSRPPGGGAAVSAGGGKGACPVFFGGGRSPEGVGGFRRGGGGSRTWGHLFALKRLIERLGKLRGWRGYFRGPGS